MKYMYNRLNANSGCCYEDYNSIDKTVVISPKSYNDNCYIDKMVFHIESASTYFCVIYVKYFTLIRVRPGQSNTAFWSPFSMSAFIEWASLLSLWAGR